MSEECAFLGAANWAWKNILSTLNKENQRSYKDLIDREARKVLIPLTPEKIRKCLEGVRYPMEQIWRIKFLEWHIRKAEMSDLDRERLFAEISLFRPKLPLEHLQREFAKTKGGWRDCAERIIRRTYWEARYTESERREILAWIKNEIRLRIQAARDDGDRDSEKTHSAAEIAAEMIRRPKMDQKSRATLLGPPRRKRKEYTRYTGHQPVIAVEPRTTTPHLDEMLEDDEQSSPT